MSSIGAIISETLKGFKLTTKPPLPEKTTFKKASIIRVNKLKSVHKMEIVKSLFNSKQKILKSCSLPNTSFVSLGKFTLSEKLKEYVSRLDFRKLYKEK